MKKLLMLSMVIAVAVLVSPKLSTFPAFDIEDIATDAAKTYPHSATQDCAWFREGVSR